MPSSGNPADIASRGTDPITMKDFDIRWKGRYWLTSGQFPFQISRKETTERKRPSAAQLNQEDAIPVIRPTEMECHYLIDLLRQIFFDKTVRVVAHMKTFIGKISKKRFSKVNCRGWETSMQAATKEIHFRRHKQLGYKTSKIRNCIP